MGALISIGSYQLALFAGVKPGVYEVFIDDDPVKINFSTSGNVDFQGYPF